MVFKLVKDDPDQHLYLYQSFLLNIHWNDMRVQNIAAIAQVCDQVIKEHRTLTSLVFLRGAINVDLSTEMRKAAASLTERFNPYSAGQAMVIEANGFMASLARSVITGVNLVARAKTNQRVFQNPREGAEWLLELPSQPPALRGSFPKLWPHIQEIMHLRSRAEQGQARIAG
jgi:hypothetical protein